MREGKLWQKNGQIGEAGFKLKDSAIRVIRITKTWWDNSYLWRAMREGYRSLILF